ncbi:MAG TPA: hypothetical protein VFA26_04785 [Gemmataceae bacterium]|nr:hypothetical protein [Gemmataceae bacterium]
MNILARPPVDPPGNGRPDDELDGLLYAFFRRQMPDPWPAFRRPARPAEAPRQRSRWAGFRPYLALAASVALLVIGSWMLSARSRPATPLPGGTDNSATRPRLDQRLPDLRMKESLIQPEAGPTIIRIEVGPDVIQEGNR